MTKHRFWIVRCLCICFWLGSLSGVPRTEAGPRIGLVAVGTGWVVQNQGIGASSDHHLFWTSDDGNNWKDITPRDPASRQIAGAFFLDAAHGWVLLAIKHEGPKKQESDNSITDISGFDVASTSDGGASWTIKSLASLPAGVGWIPASEIFFLNPTHGWINIESPVPHWGGAGDLLTTSDGGQTWQLALENAPYGSLRFDDLQNGWMAGGPDDTELYVTHDGGRHWNEVKVPVPQGILNLFKNGPTAGEYGVPLFKDSKRGFLSVTYHEPGAGPGEDMRTLALFSTSDGGFVWHSESWVNLGEDRGVLAFTVVDSQALAPKPSARSSLTLLKLGLAGKSTETEAGTLQLPNTTAISRLDFSDTSHGWASLSDGRLLSTADGGLTWKDVTPGDRRTSTAASAGGLLSNATAAPLQSTLGTSLTSAVTTASSSITTHKSLHLGFDRCTLPSTSQMSTWWTSSPYFDYGVYVGGVSTNCAAVSSSWVNTVTGQGWGLIPIWVGPQAPCSQFASKISTTGGAYAQGQTEANAATKGTKAKMEKLGLGSGSVIYYDIENYDPTATCNGNPTGS